jgi:hypothetical protein
MRRIPLAAGDVDFWSSDVGVARGFWFEEKPADLQELWLDVSAAMDEVKRLADRDPRPSMMEAANTGAMAVLGQCDRAALWGLVS